MFVNWIPRKATQDRGQSSEPRSAAEQSGRLNGNDTYRPNSERSGHRHDGLTRFFHWIFTAAIIYTSVAGYALTHIAGGAMHDILSRLNMSIATLLIVLFPLRVVWKFVRIEPRALPGMPGWQRTLATGIHNLIYVTIFVVLASGFLMVPNGYSFFGLIEIHTPFPKGALTEELFTVHRASCALLAGLVVLHVLAVIKHQLIARNDVLRRML